MGYKHTPVEASHSSNKEDPTKTEAVLKGGEVINETKHVPEATTEDVRSDPNDPTKTIATLSSAKTFNIIVKGEFEGETTAKEGSVLKFALQGMVKDDGPSYGSFKYRDLEQKPVSISTIVTGDLSLFSVRKG